MCSLRMRIGKKIFPKDRIKLIVLRYSAQVQVVWVGILSGTGDFDVSF